MSVRQRLLFLSLLWAVLWGLSAPAHAVTTGSIEIRVVDDLDLEVPNAVVVLSGPHMVGGARELTTDTRGIVVFGNLLPADDYAVEITSPAGDAIADGLSVLVGRTVGHTVAVNMGPTVIVPPDAKPIDPNSTTDGRIFDKYMLDRLPTGQTVEGAIKNAAGVVGSTAGFNGNFVGSAFNENTILIDGAEVTDPVTGTFSANFNYGAIEQLQVLLGGYMPEYGVSLGSVVNIVTASGSNTLEFQSSVLYTNGNWRPRMDERLSSDGTVIAPSGFDNSFQTIQLGALVSGPIIRDKAFFVLSYQQSRSLIAASGTPQRRDFDGHYVLGKITLQPNSQHRFTAFVQMDPTTIDNNFQGDPFIKSAAQGRQSQGGFVSSARWLWSMGSNLDLDTSVTVQKSYLERGGVPCTHDRDSDRNPCKPTEAQDTVDWESPGRDGIGGAFDTVNNVLFDFDDRWRVNVGSKLTARSVKDPLGGVHDIKVGMEGQQLIWDKTFGVNGNLLYVDINATPFDPESFTNYYWFEYSQPFSYRTTGSQLSFFAQDSYKPVRNLTVNYGTRFDRAVMRNDIGDPVLNAAMLGPRLYAAWDPWADGKTKIATGVGRFNDTGRLAVADFTSRSGFGSKLFVGELFEDGSGQGFVNSQGRNFDYQPNVNTSTAHDTLRNPYTDEVIVILERQVAPTVALSSRISTRFTRNMYEHDERSIIYDEDGTTNIGSRFGDPDTSYFRVRTPQLARRTVFKWDLEARRVFSRRWFAEARYTFTRALGSSAQALSGSFANDPQVAFNYGLIPNANEHVFVAQGGWDVPLDPWAPLIGVTFVAGSGVPVERLYWQNRGAGGYGARIADRTAYTRLEPFWDLSLRLQQTIDVRKGAFRVSFEAQNLLNNRAGGRIASAQLTGGRSLEQQGRAVRVERQDPLRLQLGARYDF